MPTYGAEKLVYPYTQEATGNLTGGRALHERLSNTRFCANQIAILFNATEPGSSINVTDVTLNFFSPTGTLITSLDGQQAFPSTFAGNGVAGFVFVVDATEQAVLNSTIFASPDFGSVILSLTSSLTGATGGPDTFRIVNLSSPPVAGDVPLPEPATLLLVALGCVIAARSVRRER